MFFSGQAPGRADRRRVHSADLLCAGWLKLAAALGLQAREKGLKPVGSSIYNLQTQVCWGGFGHSLGKPPWLATAQESLCGPLCLPIYLHL